MINDDIDFIEYKAPQGTDEWLQARAGVITASMVPVIRAKIGMPDEKQQAYIDAKLRGLDDKAAMEVAGYKTPPRAAAVQKALAGEPVGDWSDTAKKYAFRLAVERIAGSPLDDGYQTWAMKRGNELEPIARMAHEARTGVLVREVGFVTTPCGTFGASADGFENGNGCEYKCFIDPEKIHDFWVDFDASVVKDQMSMGMWITGAKKWHLGMYCPALEPVGKELWLQTFERDDDYIDAMVEDLLDFSQLVDEYEAKLRA